MCDDGIEQHQRLAATHRILVEEDFVDFQFREQQLQCMHAAAIDQLVPTILDVYTHESSQEHQSNGPAETHTHQLCSNPLLVAIETAGFVNLLQYNRRSKRIACTCKVAAGRICTHIKHYEEWRKLGNGSEGENEHPPNSLPSRSFSSISKSAVPYPLPENLAQVFVEYERRIRSFPSNLVPGIPDGKCPHNEDWEDSDPVENEWRIGDVVIYLDSVSVSHTYNENGELQPIGVYFRKCKGACGCKHFYDGQEDLLFNLNNKDIIYYGVLFKYMHHMLEGRNPLAACQRALKHNHDMLSRGEGSCIPIHILRRGWNSFARLLNVDWERSFVCPVCGPHPEVIVCDGTAVGFPKRHLDNFEDHQETTQAISGTKQQQRVYINSPKVRQLLSQYAKGSIPLQQEEFRTILDFAFSHPHLYSLHNMMTILQVHPTCPVEYRLLIKNLAYNSPACAFLQGASESTVAVLLEMLVNRVKFFTSESHAELKFLHDNFPIIATLMQPLCQDDGRLPDVLYSLLYDIVEKGKASYDSVDTTKEYPAASTKQTPEEMFQSLDFFPGLQQLHGPGTYTANKNNNRTPCRADYDCNKVSRGHPTLTPGIFTIYCEHGVCYGFEVMKRHESPAVPFEIFKTRFPIAPRIVVYDNACHLHQYCLNREPLFFKRTTFLVDRMHMKGHTGCCLGYDMDTYKTLDIKKLNSQVNEQENAGIARIKGQLSYMLPTNFMFHAALFLALRNKSKVKNLLGDGL